MKNKNKVMDVVKEFLKDLRPEMVTGAITTSACAFLIGTAFGSSAWAFPLLILPILLSVFFSGLIGQIIKYNTMADESRKRVGLIMEYNQVIKDLRGLASNDATD